MIHYDLSFATTIILAASQLIRLLFIIKFISTARPLACCQFPVCRLEPRRPESVGLSMKERQIESKSSLAAPQRMPCHASYYTNQTDSNRFAGMRS